MRHQLRHATVGSGVVLVALLMVGCETVPDASDTSVHPKATHPIFNPTSADDGQHATGVRDSTPVEQPIPFTHYRHVTVLGMDCQYCHTEARRSVNAGIPPVETCMGCHTYVKTDSEPIQAIAGYWERGEAIPWQRVHDLPDYVHFSHKRHVKGGVECTECHGQIAGMGQWVDGSPEGVEVMWREGSLQMGWCLDCHSQHGKIDENYGEQADLRRAELKDCWTCHK